MVDRSSSITRREGSRAPRYRRLQRALLLARPLCGRGRPCSLRACDASILTDVSKRKDSANEFATQVFLRRCQRRKCALSRRESNWRIQRQASI